MTTTRPTVLLVLSPDNRFLNPEMEAALNRSYAYVAPMMIEGHDSSEESLENIVYMKLKFPEGCWKAKDDALRPIGDEALKSWLQSKLNKVSAALSGFRISCEDMGLPFLKFDTLQVVFDGREAVSVPLCEDSSIPSDATSAIEAALLDKRSSLSSEECPV